MPAMPAANDSPAKTPGTQAPASEKAREAKRYANMCIDENWDDNRKCYRNGRTDKNIAEEFGLSETVVRDIRLQFYGEIKEPDEVGAIKSELSALQTELSASLTKIEEGFTASIETTRQAALSAISGAKADAETRAKSLRSKLDELAKRNNWAG